MSMRIITSHSLPVVAASGILHMFAIFHGVELSAPAQSLHLYGLLLLYRFNRLRFVMRVYKFSNAA